MNIRNILKEYWVSILLIIFGGVLEFLSLTTTILPSWQIGIIVITVAILQIIDKRSSNKDFTSIKTKLTEDMAELKQSNKEQQKANEEQKRLSEEQIKLTQTLNKNITEKQKVRMNLVAKLVDKGMVSQTDVVKHFEGIEIFMLYCYPSRSPISNENDKTKRLYPVFLQSRGFVRMSKVSTFFIITANRLTKRLQDPNTLKEWLLRELNTQLETEWRTQLEKLRIKGSKTYERYRDEDFSKYLSMDILIFKTKISNGNIGIINKNILPTDFTKMVGIDVKLENIKIEDDKKIEVRKFVLGSSFRLFFTEIPDQDLKKLLKLENKIKEKLSINNIVDYTEKSEEDIKNIFMESFSEAKALEYAKLLKTQAKEYEDALKEIGISTAS